MLRRRFQGDDIGVQTIGFICWSSVDLVIEAYSASKIYANQEQLQVELIDPMNRAFGAEVY